MKSDIEYKRSIRGGQLIPTKSYPVSPKDIDPVRIGDVFGKNETESACKKIVEGLTKRDKGWDPFTLSEVGLSEDYPGFADLVERGLIIGWVDNGNIGKEDTFLASHVFISMLFYNAPSWNAASTRPIND